MDKVRLTKQSVEGIAPVAGRQVVVWDKDLTGFGVRVSPGGARSFFVQSRIRGKVRKITIGKLGTITAEKARKTAKLWAAEMSLGRDPAPKRATTGDDGPVSLGDLLTAYADMLEADGKASARNVRNQIKTDVEKAFPRLWKKPAEEVSLDDCVAIVARLHDAGKPRQADKIRSYLKTAYRRGLNARGNVKAPAVMRRLRLAHNPAGDIEKVAGSSNAATRALSVTELQAYWKRLDDLPEPRRSVGKLHVLTGGQRMAQLARATTADLDRATGTLTLRDTKGRRKAARVYAIPMLPAALECIDAIGGGPFIFSADGGHTPCSTQFFADITADVCCAMAAADELEGAPFTAKVIRATVETRLMKKPYRVSSDVLARWLSHGLGGVQARHYVHDDFMDEIHEAAEKLWRLLEAEAEPVAEAVPIHEEVAG